MDSLSELERSLHESGGQRVLHVLAQLGSGASPDQEHETVLPLLSRLGLGKQDGGRFRLNNLGHKCADAAREYAFWVQRGKRIHGEDSAPALMLSNFAGKRLLEVGPGWGCNLFRLQQVTPHARGLEIEPAYIRFTAIFAGLEGITPPVIDVGGAESIPYPDGSFDWVLLFSVFQYVDVRKTAREIARVLAPGGRLLASFPHMASYLRSLPSRGGGLRDRLQQAICLLNTLSYGLAGRRLIETSRGKATSRPIYLTQRQMTRILEQARLRVLPSYTLEQGRDLILVAEKPVDPSVNPD